MPDFLTVNNLGKRYGSSQYVIQNFNRSFEKGSATGLIGPNGSGKTTFIRMLTTSAFPTEGEILFKGENIHQKPHAFLEHIGMAGDVSNLPEYLNAVEVLEWILRARSKWDDSSSDKIAKLLDALELDERRMELIGTYSSGMMQKTLIASALISNPEIIVLDEPFRALDESSKAKSIELLKSYNKNGGTIMISSHLKSSLELLCLDYVTFPILN